MTTTTHPAILAPTGSADPLIATLEALVASGEPMRQEHLAMIQDRLARMDSLARATWEQRAREVAWECAALMDRARMYVAADAIRERYGVRE